MMLLSSRNVRRESKLLRLDILARRCLERQGLMGAPTRLNDVLEGEPQGRDLRKVNGLPGIAIWTHGLLDTFDEELLTDDLWLHNLCLLLPQLPASSNKLTTTQGPELCPGR